MAVVTLTAIHPRPGTAWGEVQKQLKRACDLTRKHGAEDVTVLATMTVLATTTGEPATNTIGLLCRTKDLTRYSNIQQAVMDDPETQALLVDASQIATWETYVSQTMTDMLALWASLTSTPRPDQIRELSSGSVRRLRDSFAGSLT